MLTEDFPILDLPGSPSDHRIAVAMSGGVDSSVVASLLHERGYNVIGITLRLYDHGAILQKKGACCAGQDIYDAARVAETRGFPHYVLDYESIFKQKVMDDFADTYLQGSTPIPCVQCNQKIKFVDLLKTAQDLGAVGLATGHYLQRIKGANKAELYRAADLSRDQSYFLYGTTQEQAEYLHFPLGGLQKSRTRELAQYFNLPVADKPDSQDICFVPNGNYADLVKKMRPGSVEPGDILNLEGEKIGRHRGIVHYTVGQRRGLGLPGGTGDPLFVVKIDATRNQITVGPETALLRTEISVTEVNWLGDHPLSEKDEIAIAVKVRSTREPKAARLKTLADGAAHIVLNEGETAVSPGQAAVFYESCAPNARLLGGGRIISAAA